MWYKQVVLRINCGPYWPVHPTSLVSGWRNIYCGLETCSGYSPGNYISAFQGKFYIDDYTQIAPSVGALSQNHKFSDNREFQVMDFSIENINVLEWRQLIYRRQIGRLHYCYSRYHCY